MISNISAVAERRPVVHRATRSAGRVERAVLVVAAALFTSGVVHLGILLLRGDTWVGPLSWRKAATFGTSFGLTLAAVTWAGLLLPRSRAWSTLLGVFAAACTLETLLVSLQVWRGVPSHFNYETPLDTAIAMTLAFGGGVLVLCGLGFTVIAFRATRSAPVLLALRASFVALLAGFAVGIAMIADGVRLARGGAPQLAYATAGHLKPLHAVLLHGVLVLLPVPWLAARLGGDDQQQLRSVQVAVAAYALFAAGVAWQVVA